MTIFHRFHHAVLLLLTLVLAGCEPGGKDKDDAPEADKKTPATTQAADHDEGEKVKLTAQSVEQYGLKLGKANLHVLTTTFVAPARVAFNAEATARVASAVAGRIVELKAKRGDDVGKDDELFIVESTDLGEAQSDYLLKKSALAAAAIAIGPTKTSYERAKNLYEQSQGLSLGELQKREGDYRAAQAAWDAAGCALDAAKRKLTLLGMSDTAVAAMAATSKVSPRYVVHAPIAGRVIERDATLGQYVTPDKDAIIQLADMSTFWILADVPEARLIDITPGVTVRVTVPTVPGAIRGTIAFIPSTVDSTTRSAQVRVVVAGDSRLKAGMFAQVEIESSDKGKAKPVVAVPEEAIQIINGQTCVFVEDDDEENTFLKRPVAVGPSVNGLVPIFSGLKEKEEIVKYGGFYLKAEFAKSSVKDND